MGRAEEVSGEELFHWTDAVAVSVCGRAHSLKQGEPDITERRSFWQYEVMAEMEACATASD
jgi:hypothetical protein